MRRIFPKIGDFTIIISLILISFIIFFIVSQEKNGDIVNINIDDKEQSYSINEDREVHIDGIGNIIINKGEVFVEEMSCPDKLCEKTGHISKKGESIICLPNKLVIKISDSGDLDGISS